MDINFWALFKKEDYKYDILIFLYSIIFRYAIHNSGKVGITLKKVGDSNSDLRTQLNSSIPDNIGYIYSPDISRELLEYTLNDDLLKFKAHGYITNPNYNVKKFNFLLFINHRLVESSALKKAFELVYSHYVPKGTHPFVYLSLEIAAENIDVNVHPTKFEVHFLHQDDIIDELQKALDARLLKCNSSRTFYTQSVLPGAPVPVEQNKTTTNTKSIEPKNMVRTDAKEQKLDKFLTKSNIPPINVVKPHITPSCDNTDSTNSLEKAMQKVIDEPMEFDESNIEKVAEKIRTPPREAKCVVRTETKLSRLVASPNYIKILY